MLCHFCLGFTTFSVCWSVLGISAICISINQDFVEFSRKNEQHVLCHGERYMYGCVYKFEIPNGYVIYIATEEYKVKSIQICQKEKKQSLATIPEWLHCQPRCSPSVDKPIYKTKNKGEGCANQGAVGNNQGFEQKIIVFKSILAAVWKLWINADQIGSFYLKLNGSSTSSL